MFHSKAVVLAAFVSIAASGCCFAAGNPLRVGVVTRHASRYIGHQLTISGFILGQESGYALVSDEASGRIGHFDLPVVGATVSTLKTHMRYEFEGRLVGSGLKAVNGDPVHLELIAPPIPSKKP
jgi:hypothetical protein